MNKQPYPKGTVLYLTKEAIRKQEYRWFAFKPFKVGKVYDHYKKDQKDITGHQDFEEWREEFLYAASNFRCLLYGDELTLEIPNLLTPPKDKKSVVDQKYCLSWLYSILSLDCNGHIVGEDVTNVAGWSTVTARRWDVSVSSILGNSRFWIQVPEKVHSITVEVALCAMRRSCEIVESNEKTDLEHDRIPFSSPKFDQNEYAQANNIIPTYQRDAVKKIKELFGSWYLVLLYAENDLQNLIEW